MHTDESEVLTAPLPAGALAKRWRELIDDPRYADVPGKFELDDWGRITVAPVSTSHAAMAGRLTALVLNALGGQALPEVGIATAKAIYSPDVAWCSEGFWSAHRDETPLRAAPEICIEVVSPSNSRPELLRKTKAYLAAGAVEVWLVFRRSARVEFHGPSGRLDKTAFEVDLSDLFR